MVYTSKKFLIIGISVFLLITGGSGYYLYSQQKRGDSSDNSGASSSNILAKEYTDPNLGFSFKYPQNFSLDPHDEDQENYAHIELSQDWGGGRILIWVKDPPEGTLDEFIASDSILKDGSILDTKWGGVSAKKIKVSGGEGDDSDRSPI